MNPSDTVVVLQVLMRALRDFNLPKIVTDDVPIFMGLIGDLFPTLEVQRRRDLEFEQAVRETTVELHLQPEEIFVLKVSEFCPLSLSPYTSSGVKTRHPKIQIHQTHKY